MGFSRQEYLCMWPLPSPGALSNPEIKPRSPALQPDSLLSEPPGKTISEKSFQVNPSAIRHDVFAFIDF